MKTGKEIRKVVSSESQETVRKPVKLDPIKKSGKDKHYIFSADEEDDDIIIPHKRESVLDYFDDEEDGDENDEETDDEEFEDDDSEEDEEYNDEDLDDEDYDNEDEEEEK